MNTTCQIGVQTLTLIILGRLLDPKAFGLMAMVMVVVEFVNVYARMGIGEAIIYKQEVARNELSSLFFFNIAVGLFICILVFLSSDLISHFYSEPEIIPLIKLISSLFLISSIGIVFEALLLKHLLLNVFSKINIFSNLFSFVLTVILAFGGKGVYSLVFGQIGLQVFKSGSLIFFASKNNWLPFFHFRFGEVKFYLKFGIYRALAMSANQFNSRVDQLLIGAMLGPTVLGYYYIAFQVIYLPIQKISPILTQVAFPFFSIIQDDTFRLKNAYLKYINLILSINAPVLAGVSALAPILIPFFLGKKWTPAIPIIQALTIYVFIRSIFNANGSLICAKGKANWEFFWNMTMLCIVPTTAYIVLKISGSVVLLSLTLGGVFFIGFFFLYVLMIRPLLGAVFKEFIMTIARPAILAATMGIFVHLLLLLISNWPYAYSGLVLVLFGILYYVGMTLLFNPLFVDELERVLPDKMGRAVSRIRDIAR